MLSARLCPTRGFVVAESLLSWLVASVTTSSCHAQASLPLQLSAWCVCMVVILILGGICTQSATFAIFKSWKCPVFLLNTIYAKRAKMDRMLTIAPVVIPRPSYMLLLYSNRSTQSSTLVLWLMRSLRPFRHASLFPDSRLLAVLQLSSAIDLQGNLLLLPTSCCLRRRRRGYASVCAKMCCRPYSLHILEEELRQPCASSNHHLYPEEEWWKSCCLSGHRFPLLTN